MKGSLFISGLVFTIASFGLHVVCPEEEEGRSKKFDFFVFSQIWPITSCDLWEARESSNTCFLPQEIDGRWTVYGPWPTLSHGPLGPFRCNTTPFNPDSVSSILDKLNIQWTDIHKNARKEDFWEHEWSKHGTCAMQLEPLNTELKYFSKGLDPKQV
jgi:ribonuclease T2